MTALSDTIADLWRGLDDTPDDLGRLLVIADAYRDEGMDTWADCLEWCYQNRKKPIRLDKPYSGVRYEWICRDRANIIYPSDSVIGLGFLDVVRKESEYYNGSDTPSLAYQFLCRMWDEIGGVKEDV